MKRIYAINGSPRKNWNTAELLDQALEGAKAVYPDREAATEQEFLRDRYEEYLQLWEGFAGNFFGYAGHYYAFDTYQFDDYNKYVSDWFSEAEKATYKKQHWAADREAAYELGKKVMVSMSHRKSK